MAGIGQHLPSERAVPNWNPSVPLNSMGRKANLDPSSYSLLPGLQSEPEKKVLPRDEHRLPPSTTAALDGSNLQVNSSLAALPHPSSSLQHLNTGTMSGVHSNTNPQQDWHHLLASVSSGNSSLPHSGTNEGSLSGPVVSSSSNSSQQQQSLLLSQPQHHGATNGFSSDMSTANAGPTTSEALDHFRQQQISRQQSNHLPLSGAPGHVAAASAVSSSTGSGGGSSGLPPPSHQFTKSVPTGIKRPTPLYSGSALDPVEFPSLVGATSSSNSRSFGAAGGVGLSSSSLGSSGFTSGLASSLTASLGNVSTSGRNYVTVMSRGATGSNEQAEFSIQQEDFPALPGSQNPPSNTGPIAPGTVASESGGGQSSASAPNPGIPSSLSSSVALAVSSQNSVSQTSLAPQALNWQQQQQVAAQHAAGGGDQHSGGAFPSGASAPHTMSAVGPGHVAAGRQPGAAFGSLQNGMLAPVPPRNAASKAFIRDQYGLLGLAMVNQAHQDYPNVKMLTNGINLNELGINMNAPEFHYNTFVSPFSLECFGRPQDMDYPVTKEYHMAHLIRSRLPPIDLEKKEEDTLFWLFYNCTGEDIQLAAAKELYRRDWRFHKHEQVWIAKSGSNFERLPNQNGERGQYTVFHPGKWERTTQNFTLYYDSLDNAPPKFPNFNPYNVSALNNTAGASAAPAAASTGNAGHH